MLSVKQSETEPSHWYAIRTKPKQEQRVLQAAQNALLDATYLPVIKVKNRWAPLFQSYLFVKHGAQGYHRMKYQPGVMSYVCLGLYPTEIPEQEIQLIKQLEANFHALNAEKSGLQKGTAVRIMRGPLAGYNGALSQDQQGEKITLNLYSIGQGIQVRLTSKDIILL